MKAKEIKTEIVIDANKEVVWEVLTNFIEFPKWNPFIQFIEGEIKVGSKLKVKIVPPNSKGMTFKPIIIKLEEHKKLFWLGHFLFNGLLDGQHQFELIENRDGTTTFIQNETFKGLLIPFLGKKFEANTKSGFTLMNSKLKEKIEFFNKL